MVAADREDSRIPAPQFAMTLERSGDTVPLLSVGRLLCPGRACNQSFLGATRLRLDVRCDSLSSQTKRLSEHESRLSTFRNPDNVTPFGIFSFVPALHAINLLKQQN